jgi:hypothetical protein
MRARKKPGKTKAKPSPIERVKEITVSISGVIPTGPFENMKPGFSMTVEPKAGVTPEAAFRYVEKIIIEQFSVYRFGVSTPFQGQKQLPTRTTDQEFAEDFPQPLKKKAKKKAKRKKRKKGVKK